MPGVVDELRQRRRSPFGIGRHDAYPGKRGRLATLQPAEAHFGQRGRPAAGKRRPERERQGTATVAGAAESEHHRHRQAGGVGLEDRRGRRSVGAERHAHRRGEEGRGAAGGP